MSPFIHTGVDGASSSHQDFLESMKQLKDVSTLISVLWDEQSLLIKKKMLISFQINLKGSYTDVICD